MIIIIIILHIHQLIVTLEPQEFSLKLEGIQLPGKDVPHKPLIIAKK